jgi:signal transduction histidine kinase/CheY-like chemotaxis protein
MTTPNRRRSDPPAPEEFSARVARRVRFDLIRSHYHLTPQPVIAGIVFAAMLAWAVSPSAGAELAWIWFAGKALIGGLRLLEGLQFARDPQAEARAELWYRRYFVLMAADALTWGAIGVLFVPSGHAYLDGVLLASVAGVAAAGVFTLLGSLLSAGTFLSFVLLPSVAFHLSIGGAPGLLAGVGLLIYFAVLVFESWRGEHLFIELMRLRRRNEWIAEQHRRSMVLAQQSSAAKSRFLATVSHEVRTPLNGILGMAQLLQRSTLDARQRQQVDTIAGGARHLRTIIDDILDMARIESGRLRIEAQPFELAAMVREVADTLAPLAHDKGLQFEVRRAAGLAPRWRGDAARIRQVLHNLVGNAIKYTAAGRVELRIGTRPDGLRFEVVDTGPGIPADALERIFEPFEQVDNGAARSSAGTGLGLAIARQLARAMGGDVQCSSVPGRGSTFRFDVALDADDGRGTPRTGGAAAAPEGAELPPAHVLVVEDNPVNAVVVRAMLAQFGLQTDHADSGEVALERLERAPFDLVLMDCQMPGLDGLETTRRWRAREARVVPPTRLPIVAVTANASAGDRERCLEAGMDDYIAKPFEMDALRAVVERVLRARSASR